MASDITHYDFKEGLPIEFEIVSIHELYKTHRDLMTIPHRTGFYHIIWFQKGYPTHLVDFTPVKVSPGSLLFLNKDTVQVFDKHGDFEGKAILFTDSFFCREANDIKYLQSSILFNDLFSISKIQLQKSSGIFSELFSFMEAELTQGEDNFHADILKNLLHSFLLLADRERRKQDFTEIKKGADLDYLLLFKDLLEIHFGSNKQVSFYASLISVTMKRLNQASSKILGKTPKQMIDDRVMLEAKRLLAHTSDSIKEIGFRLGFDEPTNFIKYFKNHQNTTPVEFRDSLTK